MIDEVGFVELGDFAGDCFELSSHTTMIARTRGPATVSSLKNRLFLGLSQGHPSELEDERCLSVKTQVFGLKELEFSLELCLSYR
jgi:hypothetical protein